MVITMVFYGLQKLSLLDYPGKICCTVFTGGCNFRCPFCHNASLVFETDKINTITEDEILNFLESRKGKLDAVCISGGEPLINPLFELEAFFKKIKDAGFLIKLDTNGSFPEKLKHIIESGLADFVAMDIKNSFSGYSDTIGIKNYTLDTVKESAGYLMKCGIPYEFRTTLVKELHTADDIKAIGQWIKGAQNYYLQAFKDSGDLINSGLSGFSKEEMTQFKNMLSQYVQNVEIRGI